MNLWTLFTSSTVSAPPEPPQASHLQPSPSASQTEPRGCYVFAHVDERGVPFYVGKGSRRRAWDARRHPLWLRYVERHLKGRYSVLILADNLAEDEAEELESEWFIQEAPTLVNRVNTGHQTDFEALERQNNLRAANRERIARARALEKTDPERAVALIIEAIDLIAEYATIATERGLLGKLLGEEREENGISGELLALDRLTLGLVRLGRTEEARRRAEQYFALYRADAQLRAADTIKKRVARKGRAQLQADDFGLQCTEA